MENFLQTGSKPNAVSSSHIPAPAQPMAQPPSPADKPRRGRGRPPKDTSKPKLVKPKGRSTAKPVDVSAPKPLSTTEQKALRRLEARIAAGQLSFVDVGMAIAEIRDRKLYREKFKTIEEYLSRRWNMGKAHGFRLINAATVMQNLSPIGDKLPLNEAQVRPLLKLENDEQRKTVWSKVVDEAGATGITAKLIQDIATREFPKPDPDADRLAAARQLQILDDFVHAELVTATGRLEPKSVKLLIVNTELTDPATVLSTLCRFLHDDCGVVAISDFRSEPEARKALVEGKCELLDRCIWYGQIEQPKTTGPIARHRSILLAARGEFSFYREGVARLPDPLVRAPDGGFLDAPPVDLFRAIIEAFTIQGEMVVIPADRYAAGVIAARKARRSVLGVEREEQPYLLGRERLDKIFDAPRKLDKLIEDSLTKPADFATTPVRPDVQTESAAVGGVQ